MSRLPTVELGGFLEVPEVWAVAADRQAVGLAPEARDRMRAAEQCLAAMVADRRRIYGVTTGYGPLARHYVTPECAQELQRNLLYHLATGVGRPLSALQTRAVMLARFASLAQGHSAIGQPAFQLLLDCLNADLLPVVPEMGTVGASGDLTPLAHVALLLTAEGDAVFRGRRLPGRDALAEAGLQPVTLGYKEGLALVNGTSATTGIAAVNATRARRLVGLALCLGLLYAECLGGFGEAFDPRFGQVRRHPGQQRAHARLAGLCRDGSRLRPLTDPPRLDDGPADGGVLADRALPQDPYTIRCLPQVLGAALDVLAFHDAIVETELNAATDNPLIFAEDAAVLHGGNFFGQHVGYAADTQALAVVNIAVHAERSLARLTDPTLNGGLPAFLQQGTIGLNSGFMGAQVTASALVAEMRSRAHPASIQSIPTNANNQDVVPMGTIAARKASDLLDLAWLVLAIHGMALAQAFELLGGFSPSSGFSASSRRIAGLVRARSAFLDRDRPECWQVRPS
jgi:tyrosine ammonia-lyase